MLSQYFTLNVIIQVKLCIASPGGYFKVSSYLWKTRDIDISQVGWEQRGVHPKLLWRGEEGVESFDTERGWLHFTVGDNGTWQLAVLDDAKRPLFSATATSTAQDMPYLTPAGLKAFLSVGQQCLAYYESPEEEKQEVHSRRARAKVPPKNRPMRKQNPELPSPGPSGPSDPIWQNTFNMLNELGIKLPPVDLDQIIAKMPQGSKQR